MEPELKGQTQWFIHHLVLQSLQRRKLAVGTTVLKLLMTWLVLSSQVPVPGCHGLAPHKQGPEQDVCLLPGGISGMPGAGG